MVIFFFLLVSLKPYRKYYFFGAFPLPFPEGLPVLPGKFGVGFGTDSGFVVVVFAIISSGLIIKKIEVGLYLPQF